MEIVVVFLLLTLMALALAGIVTVFLLFLGVKQVAPALIRSGVVIVPFLLLAVGMSMSFRSVSQRTDTPATLTPPQDVGAVEDLPSFQTGVQQHLIDPIEIVATSTEAVPEIETNTSPLESSSEAVEITEYTGSSKARRVETLPEWVQRLSQQVVPADGQTFVMVSRRYSTVDEAEEELRGKLYPALREWLTDGRFRPDDLPSTTKELVGLGVIPQRVQERFDVQVGEFTESVYRVSWQVSLSPTAKSPLRARTVNQLQPQRLQALGQFLGVLTLLFAAWGIFFRANEATAGRYRGRLAVAAGSVSVIAIGVLFLA